jgi:hypothetical protein
MLVEFIGIKVRLDSFFIAKTSSARRTLILVAPLTDFSKELDILKL